MDDFTITDDRLSDALDDLRKVNRLLGGYATVMAPLHPYLRAHARSLRRPVRILDVGTGIGDIPEYIVRWADRHKLYVRIIGIDANPATVAYANAALDKRLSGPLRERIRIEVADALALPYGPGDFDVAMSSMFMHHLDTATAIEHVRTLARVASGGLIVNDLHRHPLAYHAFRVMAPFMSKSPMFRHDGSISVLRGFRRSELKEIAVRAGLQRFRITWHWAFRWCLTTLEAGKHGV